MQRVAEGDYCTSELIGDKTHHRRLVLPLDDGMTVQGWGGVLPALFLCPING